MSDYQEIYALYEGSDELHTETEGVRKAEQAASEIYKAVKVLDADLAGRLDSVTGQLARAYEKQGFLFALNCTAVKGRREEGSNESHA